MERISVFDIFKIGVGPSSSHTMGPWRAAERFINQLKKNNQFDSTQKVVIELFGSLAKTGKGHGTDIAVMLGLEGEDPVTIDTSLINKKIARIKEEKTLNWGAERLISFDYDSELIFHYSTFHPGHPNALTFIAFDAAGNELVRETYFSVGGGFVTQENEDTSATGNTVNLKFPIEKAEDILTYFKGSGNEIWEQVLINEDCWRPREQSIAGMLNIWHVMLECIYKGCHTDGKLPGGLNVTRRAAASNIKLLKGQQYSNMAEWLNLIKNSGRTFKDIIDWVSCFALAVNEENASFGRVVTAPTNGAAGVIPAVMMYYYCFNEDCNDANMIKFMATAAEIGSIFKKGSTISAAMGGCQAEIGVSSAMAAAGLTAVNGGCTSQCMMAAEIAMEHHLGLTCDPIGGLVQIPCIERNTMGAIKAITASQLALNGDPDNAKVTLDAVIKTMWETALDMNSKYKETSDGGLATNAVSVNIPEC